MTTGIQPYPLLLGDNTYTAPLSERHTTVHRQDCPAQTHRKRCHLNTVPVATTTAHNQEILHSDENIHKSIYPRQVILPKNMHIRFSIVSYNHGRYHVSTTHKFNLIPPQHRKITVSIIPQFRRYFHRNYISPVLRDVGYIRQRSRNAGFQIS